MLNFSQIFKYSQKYLHPKRMGMVGIFPDNFQNVLFDKGMMNLACQVADTGLV